MTASSFDYTIERSARKTLVITVSDGRVTVKAPKNATQARIDAFVADKSAWVVRRIAEYGRKAKLLDGVDRLEKALVGGVMYPIVRSETLKRVDFDGRAVYIPARLFVSGGAERALVRWYKARAASALKAELDDISDYIGIKYNAFALTNARTNWGSCDGKNNIRLNWRLVMLDAELMSYVAVHELVHVEHHDHSRAFWARVAEFMPGYAEAKKRLKEFSPLTSTFR